MTSHPLPPPYYDLPAYDDAVIGNRLQQVEKRLQKHIADVLKHNDVAVSEKAKQMVSNILLIYEKRFDDLGGEVRQKMDAFKDWASRLGTGEQTLIEMDKKLAKIHDKVEELDAFHAVIKRHEEREKKIPSDLLRRINALEEREEKNHDVLIDEGVMRHIEKIVKTHLDLYSDKAVYDLSKFADDIFGEKFMESSGIDKRDQRGTALIVKSILDEIKKVFVEEYIAYVDYTYSKQEMGNHATYVTILNYLNLITNKGHIYSVEFMILYGTGGWANPNDTWIQGLNGLDRNESSGSVIVRIKLVKNKESINPTKKNWDMVNKYTKKYNGITERFVWADPRKHIEYGILKILPQFEK